MSEREMLQDNLEPKAINSILDKKFFIPHYQRGFRWTRQQVEQLLDDIDAFNPKDIKGKADEKTFYCLQPVVVKKMTDNRKQEFNLDGDWYEVIDGQQRLTTIYLIIHYINEMWLGREKRGKFQLNYQTRNGCVKFLADITVKQDDSVDIDKSNIDFFHISSAYLTIRQWQLNSKNRIEGIDFTTEFQTKFFGYSKIIWYEVPETENSQALFERLNLGKIPLTNAELTKALFLSTGSFSNVSTEEKSIKQIEIARLWDEIEHRLNEPDLKFWSFITNKKRDSYDTKIELILDMISGKADDERDPLFTFLNFTEKQKAKKNNLLDVWLEIEQFYYTLLEWFKDKDLYHKVGYLITSKPVSNAPRISVRDLVKYSNNNTKNAFQNFINESIRQTVRFEISELRYSTHPNPIFNVLLLFNVETNRKSDAVSEFYPFKQHKDQLWSLEHIHARNSESFDKTKKDPWLSWLSLHLNILNEISEKDIQGFDISKVNELIAEVKKYKNAQITWERFTVLFQSINDLFTTDIESMDRDSEGLSNLALLSQPDNAALNNSVFEIKRREIIRLDKKGSFIPICTRRAFLKYYNPDSINFQHFYWSKIDREQYLIEIERYLKNDFLPKNLIEENEDE